MLMQFVIGHAWRRCGIFGNAGAVGPTSMRGEFSKEMKHGGRESGKEKQDFGHGLALLVLGLFVATSGAAAQEGCPGAGPQFRAPYSGAGHATMSVNPMSRISALV